MSCAKEVVERVFWTLGEKEHETPLEIQDMLEIGAQRRKNWGGIETNNICIGLSIVMD